MPIVLRESTDSGLTHETRSDRVQTANAIGEEINVEVLKVSEIGRDLAEAYDSLLIDQDCTFPDVNCFEVLSARRISTKFQVDKDTAEECFNGQRTVEVWEFEVFGHLVEEDSIVQVTAKDAARQQQ